MNNLKRERQRLGEWIAEQRIEAEKAIMWPSQPSLAKSLDEDANIETIVGLTPERSFNRDLLQETLQEANTSSHHYTGDGFDLEYGWAIADDVINALEPQIDFDNNLHQYDYPDQEERDEVLENAFSRIAKTSDRLLLEEKATTVYNLESVNRYQLPNLDDDSDRNQVEYADRIASELEKYGFDVEIVEDPGHSKNTHMIGRR